jgi:hypothetical protein
MKLDYNLSVFAQYVPPYYADDLASMVADELRAQAVLTREGVRRRLELSSDTSTGIGGGAKPVTPL